MTPNTATTVHVSLVMIGITTIVGFVVLVIFADLPSALALGALVPTIIGIVNGQQVASVRRSVGETNGADLTTMVKAVSQLQSYQSDRNHKIAGALTKIGAAMKIDLSDTGIAEFANPVSPPTTPPAPIEGGGDPAP